MNLSKRKNYDQTTHRILKKFLQTRKVRIIFEFKQTCKKSI